MSSSSSSYSNKLRSRVSPKVRTLQGKDLRASLSFQVRRSPKLGLVSLTLVFTLALVLAACSLLSLPLPQWSDLFAGHWQPTLYAPVYYSPLVPVALFSAALLGLPLGLLPLLGVVLMAALGLPVWTWGGLETFAFVPEAGYWGGLFLASLSLAWFVGYWLTPGKPLGWSLLSALLLLLLLVLLLHSCGCLTVLGYVAMGQLTPTEAQGWMALFSGQRALWDVTFTLLAFTLIKPLRLALSVFLYD